MVNVLSVVVNWRRPNNLLAVLQAIKTQTVDSIVCVVDCACGTEWELPQSVADKADHCVRISGVNYGPCSRFIPPLMYPSEFTAFFVDDHLPQERFLEQMLEVADELDDFATLGQQGRRVLGNTLARQRVFARDSAVPADCITTSELVRTSDVPLALSFRSDLLRENPNVSVFEDDLLLCMGVQRGRKIASFVTSGKEGTRWDGKRLPAPHALCARPNHRELRDEFVRTALKVGWQHNSV